MKLYLLCLLLLIINIKSRCLYEGPGDDPAKDGKDCSLRKITQEEIEERDDKIVSNWKCCFIKEKLGLDNGQYTYWSYCDPFKEEWLGYSLSIAGIYAECIDPPKDNSPLLYFNGLLSIILLLLF